MIRLLTHTSTALLLSTFLITSCSSGGGDDSSGGSTGTTFDGNTSPAAIDASNTEDIGTAAGESVLIANSSTDLPTGITASNSGTSVDLTEINNIIISTTSALNLPAGLDLSSDICSSGTASSSDPSSTTSGPVDLTITFNNCAVIDSDQTVSGTLIIHYDDISSGTSFSFTYQNFTVTDSSGTHTVNLTMTCSNFACTFNSDFIGSDGVTHRVANFNISGDASSGFSGDATFYHGTFGEVTITITTNITYGGNCGSIPNSGEISYSSTDGSSGTIIFSGDCTVSGSWSDSSGGSGSF